MKEFVKKAWEWIVAKVTSIPYSELLYFTVGLFVAAFFAILWPSGIGKICLFPVAVIMTLKLFFNVWIEKPIHWQEFIAGLIGGCIIQILALL